ncbi:MAG: DUF389 domain-containing protein [Anaerolineales bacterium]|nr:DUF389 domain-containing protein [Anaerolineales bacterium]
MSLPRTEAIPDDPDNLPPARRRRARRILTPLDADERAGFIDQIAHRASPTFEYFLFSLISGAVISFGFLLDSAPVLLLGALIAPFMAPMVGVSLATVTGSWRFFLRSVAGLLIGSVFVIGTGFLAGLVAADLFPLNFTLAEQATQLSFDQFILLAAGSIWTAAALVRKRPVAFVGSVALAYSLYLPLAALGLGLASGVPGLWPNGLVVFTVHVASAALIGAVTFAVLGIRPLTLFGYTLGGVALMLCVIVAVGLSSAGAAIGQQVAALPTRTPTPTLFNSPTPTPTLTATPVPPTITPTVTLSPTLEPTATLTITPSPTPVLAFVEAPPEFRGILMRAEPGFAGTVLTTLANGTLIQILSDTPLEVDNQLWVLVKDLERDIEGWVVQNLLVVATPSPDF